MSQAKAARNARAKASGCRPNLPEVEVALRAVQAGFGEINRQLQPPRDPMDDAVLENLLSAYHFMDELLTAGIDPFVMGCHQHLIELNQRVLCGTDGGVRQQHRSMLRETERRFYDEPDGGIGDIAEWYKEHVDESPWKRAAGVYVRMLSEPQLFIEGNHRTGAVMMSMILMRGGKPPFVLTVDNAKPYFDPSTVIRGTRKGSVSALFRLPRIKKEFAEFLQNNTHRRFVRNGKSAS